MTKYVSSGDRIHVYPDGAMTVDDMLPVSTYTVSVDENAKLFLKRIPDVDLPPKLYGDTVKMGERILNTFRDRPKTTGVLMSGAPGSGKTVLSKYISYTALQEGVPTILITQAFVGDAFNQLIQSINQPAIIIFDEFEKVYDRNEQEYLLTLLDGLYSSKKLFLLTANNPHKIIDPMINRPGRLYYNLEFDGLSEAFIREYAEDMMVNKSFINDLVVVSKLFRSFTFDMMQAMIEESNRYSESPLQSMAVMNVRPPSESENTEYKAEILIDGIPWKAQHTIYEYPMAGTFAMNFIDASGVGNRFQLTNINPGLLVNVDSSSGVFEYVISKDHLDKNVVHYREDPEYDGEQLENEFQQIILRLTEVRSARFDINNMALRAL